MGAPNLEELHKTVKKLRDTIEEREETGKNLDSKIEKMQDTIDNLEEKIVDLDKYKKKMNSRLPFGENGEKMDPEEREQKQKEYKAFMNFTRKGRDVKPEERKALTVADDESGGYAVPDDFRQELMQALPDVSVMRNACRVVNTGRNRVVVPKKLGSMSWYWTDEESLPTESDAKQLGQIVINTHEATGLITVSKNLLEDSNFNLEQFITEEFQDSLALEEDAVYIDGSGQGEPEGLLNNSEIQDNQVRKTDADGSLDTDDVIDLLYDVEEKYARNGTILTRRQIVRELRKLKNGNGDYLWQPSLQEGEPATFDGYPILQASKGLATEVASGNQIMVFGDFRYYWIVDRVQMAMQRLNEKYAPLIGLLFRIRRGGKCMLPEAFKVLEVA